MDRFSNILIIKPGAVGDLLQLTPTIRAIKGKFTGARVSLVVGTAADAEMFRYNPYIDATIVYNRRGEHKSFAALLGLWRQLRRERYDLVINFQRSNIKGWLLASAAFPCRVLVYRKARGRLVHAVINHLETLAPLGIDTITDLDLELYPGDDAGRFADALFQSQGFDGHTVIALNPGASNRIKCWSPAQFAALGDRLTLEFNARVIVVGGGNERDLAEGICSRMSHSALDMVGKTTLLQLGALLKKCDLLVSGDTGPMHMATAVGTRTVALFGAIEPDRTGPVGHGHRVIQHRELECVPCNAKRCANTRYLECMEKITVDEVFAVVVEMLKARSD